MYEHNIPKYRKLQIQNLQPNVHFSIFLIINVFNYLDIGILQNHI